MTTFAHRVDDDMQQQCNNNATTKKRWAPLSLPDKFNVANAKWMPACVLASREARGGAPGGQTSDVFFDRLIVQLGSRFFFDDAMCVLAHKFNFSKKYGTPTM